MRTLKEIFNDHKLAKDYGDKGSIHSYLEEYDTLLAPFRNSSSILEIGLDHGRSLLMWSEYFTNSKIVGVDIRYPSFFIENSFNSLNNNTLDIIIHDATKSSFLEKIYNYSFDIIIDDGSHSLEDQINSFNLLFKKLNPGGVYIIEDIDDIDKNFDRFNNLHHSVQIIDRRNVNHRWDDVLVVIKN